MIQTSEITGQFVQIPHSFLRDKELSTEARFLGVYLSALPKNWNVNFEQVAYELGWSYSKIRKVVKELMAFGILEREEMRDEKGRFCGENQTKINYTKESKKETNLFNQNELKNSQNQSKNTEQEASEVASKGDFIRVVKNPHTDFVQHKNKDLKEQRDFISRPRVCTREETREEKSLESYRLFNRNDLKLNLWQLFKQGEKGLKSTQKEILNPQGLDENGLKAWEIFVAHRQSIRQFSSEARKRAARKFEEFFSAGVDLSEAVEIAIARGWFCFWDKQGNLITGQKTTAQKQSQKSTAQEQYYKKRGLDIDALMKKYVKTA